MPGVYTTKCHGPALFGLGVPAKLMIVFYWLFALPVTAALGPLMTDVPIATGPAQPKDSERYTPFLTASFTEEFLAWVNVYRDAQEDDPGPPGLTPAQQLEQDINRAVLLEEGDLSDLQERNEAQRLLYVFRPSPPPADRSTLLRFMMSSTTTVAHVRQRLLRHWPDLLQANHWRLAPVDESALTSQHCRGPLELYIIDTDLDVLPGWVPLLHETQHWDIAAAHYSGTLEPKVWPNTVSARLLPHLSMECWRTPCPMRINDRVPDIAAEVQFHIGDYLLSTRTQQISLLAPVLVDLADIEAVGRKVPAHFSQQVAQSMFMRYGTSRTSSESIALRFQRTHSEFYQDVVLLTKALRVTAAHLVIVKATRPPAWNTPIPIEANELRLHAPAREDYPSLLCSMLEFDIRKSFWGWYFVDMAYGAILDLPVAAQYAALREPIPSDVFGRSRMMLAQVMVEGNGRGTAVFDAAELFMIYVNEQSRPQEWLAALYLDLDCRDYDCLIEYNARYVGQSDGPYPVREGSTLRVWVVTVDPRDRDDPISYDTSTDTEPGMSIGSLRHRGEAQRPQLQAHWILITLQLGHQHGWFRRLAGPCCYQCIWCSYWVDADFGYNCYCGPLH